jgi:DNA-binding NtrC family response regulator
MAGEQDELLEIPGGTLVDRATAGPAVRRLRLLDAAGHVVGDLAKARSSIGQQASNDVVLGDRTVSRFHCEILLDQGQARVRDLESRNGTWLDGTRVVEAYLRDGAELRLGRTALVVKVGEERVEQPVSERTELGPLVGQSVPMRAAFALLEKAAATDTTVLLDGETGTGKEGAAEALHLLSPRRDKPLVVVDCAAIPANLMESELFGHDKGSFTGAVARRIGAFEEADGGTIFLDEIGELPLSLQPKLLRVLERKEIRRVGSNQMQRLDVRVVAATHRDLRAAVNHGTYRSDLYFRLSVVHITLPPLRDRLEDIPLLAARLLQRMGAREDVSAALLHPEFLASLQRASWPGNVRELRNFLERCVVFQQALPLDQKETGGGEPASFTEERQRAIDAFERRYLQNLLSAHDGKVAAAAQQAGVGRAHLYRLLHKHGLLTAQERSGGEPEDPA